MLIKSDLDIQFQLGDRTPMLALLHLHPSLRSRLRSPDNLFVEHLEPGVPPGEGELIDWSEFEDSFGNRCSRFVAPAGHLRLSGSSIVELDDAPDQADWNARQTPVEELPVDVLRYLLPSRYCEVDRFVQVSHDLFGRMPSGWGKAVAIRDWVHNKVRFDYMSARPTKTAMDVFSECVGVCRDFQHLAVTLTRCQNIPARYATGYLGDVRSPYSGPGDFSAWYEVWLDGRWWSMDARHNGVRYGRTLMAVGRDAADVAITTSFGNADLKHFWVESNEVDGSGKIVELLQEQSVVTAA